MEFDNLIGQEFLFYGVDNHMFKINDTIWEALEDPSDGYRSYLGSIEVTTKNGIFFREPIAIVKLEKDDTPQASYSIGCNGYKLIDVDYEHTWLVFGTDNTDDYYPTFYFNYTPRQEPKPKNKPVQGKTIVSDPFDRLFENREW